MEMEMEELSFYQHLHMNPPPSPSSASGQEAFYHCYPPFAAANTNRRDHVVPIPPPPLSRQKAAVMARKDRNSKICTAGGMRDRRVRLSLDVAHRFFALQDKLGFDRASMTVQWLLDMSTTGINDMCTGVQQMPKARRRAPAPRKSNNGAPVLQDKVSRARARVRARERTKERNCLRSSVSIAEEALVPATVIPVPAAACSSSFEHGSGSYYDEEAPWELGEVVCAKSRFH